MTVLRVLVDGIERIAEPYEPFTVDLRTAIAALVVECRRQGHSCLIVADDGTVTRILASHKPRGKA